MFSSQVITELPSLVTRAASRLALVWECLQRRKIARVLIGRRGMVSV
jgi:hypothetical protein